MISVDTSQLSAWASKLATVAVHVTNAQERALTEAANEVKAEAERRAPVRTGELRSGFFINAGMGWRRVGNRTRQAFFQEFGTSKMSPQPSLFPASRRAEAKLVERLGKAGEDAL